MSRPAISPRSVVELALRPTGSAPAAEVYASANAVGLADQTLRLALRRLQAAGEVVQDGRGRAATLQLTREGRDRIRADDEALELAAGQDAGSIRWDGRWHLFAVSTPEAARARRDRLRRDLAAAGAVPVATSLSVSPHDLRSQLRPGAASDLVHAVAAELDVHGETDPAALAARLWPAAPILDGYAPLRRALAADDADQPAPVRRLLLADALDRSVREDPLIPPELRPGPWEPSVLRRTWWERWIDAGGDVDR